MLLGFAPLKGLEVEGLRLPALLALDQRLSQALELETPLLLAPNEVADRLAVIGVAAGLDLGGDSRVLLLGQRNGLPDNAHSAFSFMLLVQLNAWHDLMQGPALSTGQGAVEPVVNLSKEQLRPGGASHKECITNREQPSGPSGEAKEGQAVRFARNPGQPRRNAPSSSPLSTYVRA